MKANKFGLPDEEVSKCVEFIKNQFGLDFEKLDNGMQTICLGVYTFGLNEGGDAVMDMVSKNPPLPQNQPPKCETDKNSPWYKDPFVLKPNQYIKDNSKVTEFGDGWKTYEYVEEPEKYHYAEVKNEKA